MEEYILNNSSIITRIIVLTAALSGVLMYKKFKETPVVYFIRFLVFVFFIELIAGYTDYLIYFDKYHLLDGTVIKENYWWYTLAWTFGAPLFFLFYYKKILVTSYFKKILKAGLWYLILMVLLLLLIDFKEFFSPYPELIEYSGFIVILLCSTFYFIEIIRSENVLTFYKDINFYISAAIFCWWLISTPIMFFEQYFNLSDRNYIALKIEIMLFANVLMYSTFTYALLKCKPIRKA